VYPKNAVFSSETGLNWTESHFLYHSAAKYAAEKDFFMMDVFLKTGGYYQI